MSDREKSDGRHRVAASSALLDRLPPQNLDAEKQVIGSAIVDPSCLPALEALLGSEDFHADAHRILFEQLCAMRRAKTNIQAETLLCSLQITGAMDATGGAAYVAEVVQSAADDPMPAAFIVQDKAIRRGLVRAAVEVLHGTYNAEDVLDIIAKLLAAGTDALHRVTQPRGNAN